MRVLMAKVTTNPFKWADEVDEKDEFEFGKELSQNKKLIAFWIHFINNVLP